MIGVCATSSDYHDPKELSARTGASAMEMDETDAMFHEEELKMNVGDIMLSQNNKNNNNNNNYRHTLEAHVRGAELTGELFGVGCCWLLCWLLVVFVVCGLWFGERLPFFYFVFFAVVFFFFVFLTLVFSSFFFFFLFFFFHSLFFSL